MSCSHHNSFKTRAYYQDFDFQQESKDFSYRNASSENVDTYLSSMSHQNDKTFSIHNIPLNNDITYNSLKYNQTLTGKNETLSTMCSLDDLDKSIKESSKEENINYKQDSFDCLSVPQNHINKLNSQSLQIDLNDGEKQQIKSIEKSPQSKIQTSSILTRRQKPSLMITTKSDSIKAKSICQLGIQSQVPMKKLYQDNYVTRTSFVEYKDLSFKTY